MTSPIRRPTTAAAGGCARRSPQIPGEPAPPLAGDTDADVVILGGGYTGHVDRLAPEGAPSPASTWCSWSRTSAAAARAGATAGS